MDRITPIHSLLEQADIPDPQKTNPSPLGVALATLQEMRSSPSPASPLTPKITFPVPLKK